MRGTLIYLLLIVGSAVHAQRVISSQSGGGVSNTVFVQDKTELKSLTIKDNTVYIQKSTNTLYLKYTGTDAVDDYIVIACNSGTKAKLVFDPAGGVNPVWFGAVVGRVKERNPAMSYNTIQGIWRDNWTAFKAACNYAMNNKSWVLLPADTLEIDPWISHLSVGLPGVFENSLFPNGQVTIKDASLVVKGEDKVKSVLQLKPDVQYRYWQGDVSTTLFRPYRNAFLTIKDVTISGRLNRSLYQGYNAILKYNGNLNQIKIQDTCVLYRRLWSTLSNGDTIAYIMQQHNYVFGVSGNTPAYTGVVSGIDTINRVLTLSSNLDASITNNTGYANTFVYFDWKEKDVAIDTINRFGKPLVEYSKPDIFINGNGYPNTTIDSNGVTAYSKVLVDNCKIVNFSNQITFSGGWADIEVKNTDMFGCESGAVSRFIGDYINKSKLLLDNVKMQDGGLIGHAHIGTITDGYYGGIIYSHRTVPITINNCDLSNNKAAMLRQYSSTGTANTFIPGSRTVIKNTRFYNNAQYHLLPSNYFPTYIDNCSFVNGPLGSQIRMDGNTDKVYFNSCYFNTPYALQYGSFVNCYFDSLSNTSIVFESGAYSRCTFVVDTLVSSTNPAVLNFRISGDTRYKENSLVFSNCHISVKDKASVFPFLRVLSDDNIDKRLTIKGDFSLSGASDTKLQLFVRQNEKSVKRADVTINSGSYMWVDYNNHYQAKSLYLNKLPNAVSSRNDNCTITAFDTESLEVTPSSSAITGNANAFLVNKGTLKNIIVSFADRFIGKIKLYALDTVTIITNSTDTTSNIIGKDTILLQGQSIILQGNSEYAISQAGIETFETVIGTGDNTKMIISYSSGLGSTKAWVPGTVKVYVNNVLVGSVDTEGNVHNSMVKGFVYSLYSIIKLEFLNVIPTGQEIKIIGKRYRHANHHGFLKMQ